MTLVKRISQVLPAQTTTTTNYCLNNSKQVLFFFFFVLNSIANSENVLNAYFGPSHLRIFWCLLSDAYTACTCFVFHCIGEALQKMSNGHVIKAYLFKSYFSEDASGTS